MDGPVRRFLVGFDGSDLSRAAFAYCVVLAKAVGAEIQVIHVMEPVGTPMMAGDPSVMIDPMLPPVVLADVQDAGHKQERVQFEREMDELEDYAEEADVKCESRTLSGSLIDVLLGESHSGDVVAVGLKGRFRSSGIGSSTRALVNQSPCPVLVVSGPLQAVNRVLTPYDGSIPSTRAVVFASELGLAARWPVSVLAVARGDLSFDEALAWAQLLARDAQVIALDPKAGSEAKQIEKVVHADPYALLVMGAYADSWLKDLFTGSTTDHVLSHLKGPVILVPKRPAPSV